MKKTGSRNKIAWNPADIEYIRTYWPVTPARDLAKHFGVNVTTVRLKAYELGLRKMEMEYWTDEQVTYLKQSYKTVGDKELADIFNVFYPKNKPWTLKHIETKRKYLNLKRTPKQLKNIRERNRLAGCWTDRNRWRLYPELAAPVGTVRTWRIGEARRQYIKLKHGFVPYAPWLYEQIYGPVKHGYVVTLKDGSPENVTPGNLTIISRARLALNNSWHQYPLEVKRLIMLNNKLKRAINEQVSREAGTTIY